MTWEKKRIQKDKCDGIKTEARYTTIDELFDLWANMKRGLKNNTFENYKYMYNTFVRPVIGSKRNQRWRNQILRNTTIILLMKEIWSLQRLIIYIRFFIRFYRLLSMMTLSEITRQIMCWENWKKHIVFSRKSVERWRNRSRSYFWISWKPTLYMNTGIRSLQ